MFASRHTAIRLSTLNSMYVCALVCAGMFEDAVQLALGFDLELAKVSTCSDLINNDFASNQFWSATSQPTFLLCRVNLKLIALGGCDLVVAMLIMSICSCP